MELKWRLAHVRGYLGLGMIEDASTELDQVPPETAQDTDVLSCAPSFCTSRKNGRCW